MDKRMVSQINECAEIRTNKQMRGCTTNIAGKQKRTVKHTDKQTNKVRANIQTNEQTDKQAN